ncbi:hypothetical protein DAPPUDRAFT_108154 [Daphnia pulex]|uniref:Uncharacterized protein n=1 Tax=Daphnia pulex TaxID=6669 RepID=E9GZB4_DAPPU|nr:hypothetical protein DAPPUDRAFT_108154 [Daphnia pulex]|eukprot:EFX75120.1 hypothetical protein DAPPUDRAFT_108154 [Daphnia pulex]
MTLILCRASLFWTSEQQNERNERVKTERKRVSKTIKVVSSRLPQTFWCRNQDLGACYQPASSVVEVHLSVFEATPSVVKVHFRVNPRRFDQSLARSSLGIKNPFNTHDEILLFIPSFSQHAFPLGVNAPHPAPSPPHARLSSTPPPTKLSSRQPTNIQLARVSDEGGLDDRHPALPSLHFPADSMPPPFSDVSSWLHLTQAAVQAAAVGSSQKQRQAMGCHQQTSSSFLERPKENCSQGGRRDITELQCQEASPSKPSEKLGLESLSITGILSVGFRTYSAGLTGRTTHDAVPSSRTALALIPGYSACKSKLIFLSRSKNYFSRKILQKKKPKSKWEILKEERFKKEALVLLTSEKSKSNDCLTRDTTNSAFAIGLNEPGTTTKPTSRRPVVSKKKAAASKEVDVESLKISALLSPIAPKPSKGKALVRPRKKMVRVHLERCDEGTTGATPVKTPKPQKKFTFNPPSKELMEAAAKLTARRKSLRSSKDLEAIHLSDSAKQLFGDDFDEPPSEKEEASQRDSCPSSGFDPGHNISGCHDNPSGRQPSAAPVPKTIWAANRLSTESEEELQVAAEDEEVALNEEALSTLPKKSPK